MPAPGDLIHQQSTSTGTGNITLSSVNGKRTFNDEFGTGGTNKFDYFISNQAAAEWERGTGHLSASTTLVRDTVLASSNANAAVNFSAGTKDIANDVPAALQVRGPGSAIVGNIALWDSSAGNLLKDAGYAPRAVLTANRTYYVRTDGSDSNTGLANTSGGAFLTIQKAINTIIPLDLAGFSVTIQVGAGTYTGGALLTTPILGGVVTLLGDAATPANVIISTTSADCISVQGGALLQVSGFELRTTTSGSCLSAQTFGRIAMTGPMRFGTAATAHIVVQSDGQINTGAQNYTISGGAAYHYLFQSGGQITDVVNTVTLSGTPAFSVAFALGQTTAVLTALGQTFSGSATGKRFDVTGNAVINNNGAGSSYFPGSVAGTQGTGGEVI